MTVVSLYAYGTTEYNQSIQSFSNYINSEFSTEQDFLDHIADEVDTLSNSNTDLNQQMSSQRAQSAFSSLYNAQQSIGEFNTISNGLIGAGSAAAQDLAKAIKPGVNSFMLNYDYRTGSYLPAPAASNYNAVNSIARLTGKIILPLSLGLAATEVSLALANNQSLDAAKIATKTALSIASGLAAAAIIPTGAALVTFGVGAAAAMMNAYIIDQYWDDIVDGVEQAADFLDDLIEDALDFADYIAENLGDFFDNLSSPWENFTNNSGLGRDSDGDGMPDKPPGDPGNPEDPGYPEEPSLPFPLSLLPPIPPWLPDLFLSPLTLDLDGDGIELFKLGDYGTYFDLDGDGQATLTGWVQPDDGLLAIDLNDDGKINDITELFGNGTTDGFTLLSAYDSNSDGVINTNDSQFGELLVWIDANSDGVSQEGELHTLTDLNISEISLNAVRLFDEEIAGNSITHEATYIIDGSERSIVDVWFDDNPFYSTNVTDYDLDIRAVFLPTIKGYGQLKDLHIAASIDNGASASSLIERLADFADNLTFSDILTDLNTVKSDVEDILFRWADIEAVSPTGRGNYVDGQHLAFYEAIRGETYNQYGRTDPQHDAGAFVEEIYSYFLTYFTAQLAGQVLGEDIYVDPTYDLYRGGVSGDLEINQDAIDDVEAEAIAAVDATEVWINFALLIGYTKGLDNLTAGEITALDDAVDDTGEPSLSNWASVVAAMEASHGELVTSYDHWENYDAPYENSNVGTSGNDTITDDNAYGNLNNKFEGLDGNDIIDGLDGNDRIDGGAGNDTLTGGAGDDLLIGGTGDDIYIYTSGNDTITEENGGGTDEIHVAAATGFTDTDVTLYRQGDEMNLLFTDGSYITIDGYNSANGRIEKIVFDYDSSEIDLTSLTHETFYGTAGFDKIEASGTSSQTLIVYGYAGNDTLEASGSSAEFYGGDGYDTLIGDYLGDELYGEAQDDYLVGLGGADTLDGGAGNDFLDGGAGDDILFGDDGADTFYFDVGYGNDWIERDSITQIGVLNPDKVLLGGTLTPTDIEIYRDTSYDGQRDLTLIIEATGEQIVIEDMYTKNNFWLYGIEEVEFSDGTIWTHDSIREIYIDRNTTSGNDLTLGFESHDIFYSSLGDDVIRGYSGNDTYYWGSGVGNDTIYEITQNANNGGNDTLIFEDLTISDLILSSSGYDLIFTNQSTSETLTLDNQLRSQSFYHIEDFEFSDAVTLTKDYIKDLEDGSVTGTTGNDTMYGSAGGETLNGDSGNDLLYAAGGADTLNGNDGDDTLYGGQGSDYIYGGNDNDTIVGGEGVDMLYGQSGADIFVFDDLTSSDNIQDFTLADGDKLDISDLLIGYDPLTDAITDFVQITESSGNSYLNVDADGGADNFVQVAYIYNETGLTDEDALETSGNLITV